VLETNGTLRSGTIFDFEVSKKEFTLEVEVKDVGGAVTDGQFFVSLMDDQLSLDVDLFTVDGRMGEVGTLSIFGHTDLTFGLMPDQNGDFRNFMLNENGSLVLLEDWDDNTSFSLNVVISRDGKPVETDQVTVRIIVPNEVKVDTSDPAYHESALMIRDLDVVRDDWRNGHNPIKNIVETDDGLLVTTAEDHGRSTGDSVVLSGVQGLEVKDLKNWNFMIRKVDQRSFLLHHFGKDQNGTYDGTLGKVAEAEVNSTYVPSPRDFLLGPWTFGHLLGNMVSEQDDPVDFYRHFANQWKHVQTVNGWKTDKRERTHSSLVPSDELTLANLPFRLLAIGNRLDLFHAKSIRDVADAGEGRFVFTMTKPFPLPEQNQVIWKVHDVARDLRSETFRDFTLIFEYGQPAGDFATLAKWAKDWHKLERTNSDSFDDPYFTLLTELTDRFSKRGSNPGKPNGNPINQVRTNDFRQGIWQMREFNLFSKQAAHDVKAFPGRNTTLKVDPNDPALQSIDIGLWTTTTKNNPMVKSEPDIRKPLSRWINQRESQILDGDVGPRTPEWMDGPVADEPTSGFTYRFDSEPIRTNLARYKFSLSTCSGCHTGDTGTGFQMVHSAGNSNSRASFASFMTGSSFPIRDLVNRSEKHEFFDLKAREEIVRDILDVAQQVDAARIRLTRNEIDLSSTNEALATLFVRGGVIGDWEYELPAGLLENEFFSLNASTGELSLIHSDNLPPAGLIHIHVRVKATDGTGVVLERPYPLWVMKPGEVRVAPDLDSSVQPNDIPTLVTPRPNRTH
jgi:hypothetical protein